MPDGWDWQQYVIPVPWTVTEYSYVMKANASGLAILNAGLDIAHTIPGDGAMYWQALDGTPVALDPLPGYTVSVAQDLNAGGDIVGYSLKDTAGDVETVATAWLTPGYTPVQVGPTLPTPSGVFSGTLATAINDAGDIAGAVVTPTTPGHLHTDPWLNGSIIAGRQGTDRVSGWGNFFYAAVVTGINAAGNLSGNKVSSGLGFTDFAPWFYDGSFTNITDVTSDIPVAMGIADDDSVFLLAQSSHSNPYPGGEVWTWSSGVSTPTYTETDLNSFGFNDAGDAVWGQYPAALVGSVTAEYGGAFLANPSLFPGGSDLPFPDFSAVTITPDGIVFGRDADFLAAYAPVFTGAGVDLSHVRYKIAPPTLAE